MRVTIIPSDLHLGTPSRISQSLIINCNFFSFVINIHGSI